MLKEFKINKNLKIPTQEIKGDRGKKILIIAGVHGGENSSIQVAESLLDYLRTTKINGLLTIIPIVSQQAYLAQSRNNPQDGKNINASGTIDNVKPEPCTESDKIADSLIELASGYDYFIDLHSASDARYIRHCYISSLEDMELARNFGTEFVVLEKKSRLGLKRGKKGIGTRIREKRQIPAFVLELGAGEAIDQEDVRQGVKLVLSFLKRIGVINKFTALPKTNLNQLFRVPRERIMQKKIITQTGNVYFTKGLGELVKKKEIIGYIINPNNLTKTILKSPKTGRIVYQRIRSRIDRRDLQKRILYKIFPEDNKSY